MLQTTFSFGGEYVKCMNNLIVHDFNRKCSFCFLMFAPQKKDTLIASMTSSISLALKALLLLSVRPKFSNRFLLLCIVLNNQRSDEAFY